MLLQLHNLRQEKKKKKKKKRNSSSSSQRTLRLAIWQSMAEFSFIFIAFCILSSISKTFAASSDTLTLFQSLTHNQTLISKTGTFELGFFSPTNSNNLFLGIWYKNIPVTVRTIVWVANRVSPATKNPSALNSNPVMLLVNSTEQNQVVLVQNKVLLWSINPERKSQNPILQLLDSGNLVLRDQNDDAPENYLWQSFDYPSDTLLPGMKLGRDFRTGIDRRLTAWKDENDPSPGNLTWSMYVTNYPEPMLWIGQKKWFNSGPWNGVQYSGKPTLKRHPVFDFKYVSNKNEVYYMFLLFNSSVKARMVLNQTSLVRHHSVWSEAEQRWKVYGSLPRDFCDKYGACGPNGNCDEAKDPSYCECLKGFKPKSERNWDSMEFKEGCVREEEKALKCDESDGFVKYVAMKVPDTERSWVDERMDLGECREKCLRNCSCTAYTNSDIRGGGSGCAMWFGDLNDLRVQPEAGQDLYVRVPASLSETNSGRKIKIGIAVGGTIAVILGLLLVLYFVCRRRGRLTKNNETMIQVKEEHKEDLELPLFNLSKIANATGNFALSNKLGEGGFGAVYKGILEDGQEIAVKRLSRSGGQGIKELKNEVILIAKLQHRNLVKLLGCCIEDDEKLLIYEYMPNKSLDFFIFDQVQRKLLDWSKRFHIICGIARGLLYLHQDSRLKVIHRDLKASNVLLDNEMNPKISDFGLARILDGNQSAENTRRVVGTYGYMAPEYAIDGNFSVKSDVFSFGILLLEIVTGRKNNGSHNHKERFNLIGHVWDFWLEGRPIELIDDSFKDTCNLSEAFRCIHIGLLCLQQHPHDRPTMTSAVMMLSSDIGLPQPKQPGVLIEAYSYEDNSCANMSITVLEAR